MPKELQQQKNKNEVLFSTKSNAQIQSESNAQMNLQGSMNLSLSVHAPGSMDAIADELAEQQPYEQEEREPVVALDGQTHTVDKGFLGIFGGDGHYMKKIKGILNEQDGQRNDRLLDYDTDFNELLEESPLNKDRGEKIDIPLIDYDSDMIKRQLNESKLEQIRSRFSQLASYCRRYRFTHLWPLTRKGKERRADVVKMEKEARERLRACEERLAELRKSEKVEDSAGRAIDRSTRGGWKLLSYARTFLFGMTVRNLVNTAATLTVAVPWLVASGLKSLWNLKWAGAFSLPVPHLPGTWYQIYSDKNTYWIGKKELKKLKAEREKVDSNSREYIRLTDEINMLEMALDESDRAKESAWHKWFSGGIYGTVGYRRIHPEEWDFSSMNKT